MSAPDINNFGGLYRTFSNDITGLDGRRYDLKFGISYDTGYGLGYDRLIHTAVTYWFMAWIDDPIISFTLTGLPPGLSYKSYIPEGGTANNTNPQPIDSALIGISGNPTQIGDYLIVLNATGPGGTTTVSSPLKVRVGNPEPLQSQIFTGTVGQSFSATLAVADPVNAPFGTLRVHNNPDGTDELEYVDFSQYDDYWIFGGPGNGVYFPPLENLPPGLSLDKATGQITGVPILEGEFTTQVAIAYSTRSDKSGYWGELPKSGSATLSINIASGQSGVYSLPPDLKGGDSISVTPSWNAAGASWSAVGLPAGVSILPSTGEIVGTILTKGTFSATVSVLYGGTTYTTSLVLIVAPGAPVLSDGSHSFIYRGQALYSLDNLLDDEDRVYSDWSAITVSGLPDWASFTSAGIYTGGPPPERGMWTGELTVTGPSGSDTAEFILEVGYGWPIITPGQSFSGNYAASFSAQLTLEDTENRPYSGFVVYPRFPLPPGLSVNSSGRITGTPTSAGSFTCALAPTTAAFNNPGAYNDTDYATVTIDIAYGAPQITRPITLPTAKVGAAYTSNTPALTDAANRPVTSWSVTGLPEWASFDTTTGKLSGTPQDTGSHVIIIAAAGPGGTHSVATSLVVAVGEPIISSGQSFSGKVGEEFTAQVLLDDAADRPSDTWDATGLPAGLVIDTSTGQITGVPTSYGEISSSITAESAAGSDTKTVLLNIVAGTPIITPDQSFTAKVGASFSATPTLTDSQSRPVTSWASTGLPNWIFPNRSTGKLTGTPEDAETLTFSLIAFGPGGSDTKSVQIVVAIGAPIINPVIFSGKVGEAFTGGFTLSDAADRPATEWAASSLPAGLSIAASTGALSGTPTTRGNFVAVVVCTGPGGTAVPLSVPFSVSAGTPIITPNQFFAATQGQGFTTTPALTDATNRTVTSWTVTGLPTWAVINESSGQISGTPTSTTPASITLTATGPGGTSEPQTYIITVSASNGGGGDNENPAIPMISLVSGQSFTATLGQSFSAALALLTGTATKWYASGLPDWATINPTTGQITGVATYTGSATVLITVQEATGASSSDYISLTAVSWNTLELYIDPRGRKFLSKANSKYPLSKITMKRFDRMPFQLAFVDGSTAFSVPSSYQVTVGLKKEYGDTTYLAYATNTNGMLELNTPGIEAVFAGEPELVKGLLEVRWQDTTSAFRTATLAAEIQNSVIRGDQYSPTSYFSADSATSAASTSQAVRGLSTPIFGVVKGNSYQIQISPEDRRVSIAYPASLGDLTSVRYAQFNNSDVTDTFTKSTVQVSAPNSNVSYFVYTFIAGVPFDDYATYTVTI